MYLKNFEVVNYIGADVYLFKTNYIYILSNIVLDEVIRDWRATYHEMGDKKGTGGLPIFCRRHRDNM